MQTITVFISAYSGAIADVSLLIGIHAGRPPCRSCSSVAVPVALTAVLEARHHQGVTAQQGKGKGKGRRSRPLPPHPPQPLGTWRTATTCLSCATGTLIASLTRRSRMRMATEPAILVWWRRDSRQSTRLARRGLSPALRLTTQSTQQEQSLATIVKLEAAGGCMGSLLLAR